MKPTTPYRPLDITVPLPELKSWARTATRLHPRRGTPTTADSSVGGPLLWPADEAWPVCGTDHGRAQGVRTDRARRYERMVEAAWTRPRPPGASGPPYTDTERAELDEMTRSGYQPDRHDGSPLPLLALAQLYTRDVPDLGLFAPPGTDMLQVLWCPFTGHDDGPFSDLGPSTHLYWRRAAEVTEPLREQPEPPIVERKHYGPTRACCSRSRWSTSPSRTTFRGSWWTGSKPGRTRWWSDWGTRPRSTSTTSPSPPGWKVGGWDSWHKTDLVRVFCGVCGTEMRLLLTIDSYESGGSWGPYPLVADHPTGIKVGRYGEYRTFTCPKNPAHSHQMSIQ